MCRSLPNGTILKNKFEYRITDTIGNGGTSICYTAEYSDTSGAVHKVLLKELYPKNHNDIVFTYPDGQRGYLNSKIDTPARSLWNIHCQGFERGHNAISSLHHNDAMNTSDLFSANGTLYEVLNDVDGDTLENILNNEEIKPERTARLFKAALDAYRPMFNSNLLNLDIAPDNLFVWKTNGGENVMIIDYNTAAENKPESINQISLSKKPPYIR